MPASNEHNRISRGLEKERKPIMEIHYRLTETAEVLKTPEVFILLAARRKPPLKRFAALATATPSQKSFHPDMFIDIGPLNGVAVSE